jgi:hypothetical protein
VECGTICKESVDDQFLVERFFQDVARRIQIVEKSKIAQRQDLPETRATFQVPVTSSVIDMYSNHE